jgi:hypothetical protein
MSRCSDCDVAAVDTCGSTSSAVRSQRNGRGDGHLHYSRARARTRVLDRLSRPAAEGRADRRRAFPTFSCFLARVSRLAALMARWSITSHWKCGAAEASGKVTYSAYPGVASVVSPGRSASEPSTKPQRRCSPRSGLSDAAAERHHRMTVLIVASHTSVPRRR